MKIGKGKTFGDEKALCRKLEFYLKSNGKQLSCKQKINLVALQIEGRQLSLTLHGPDGQAVSFGNLPFEVPIKHPVEDVKWIMGYT